MRPSRRAGFVICRMTSLIRTRRDLAHVVIRKILSSAEVLGCGSEVGQGSKLADRRWATQEKVLEHFGTQGRPGMWLFPNAFHVIFVALVFGICQSLITFTVKPLTPSSLMQSILPLLPLSRVCSPSPIIIFDSNLSPH